MQKIDLSKLKQGSNSFTYATNIDGLYSFLKTVLYQNQTNQLT